MKFVIVGVLVLAAVLSMNVTADAAKDNAQGAKAFCKSPFGQIFFDSHGECMSWARSASGQVELCKRIHEWGLFDSVGDCVSWIRSNGGNN